MRKPEEQMIVKTSSIDIDKLVKSIDCGKLFIELPWQREEGQFDNYKQSMLVDTTIRGFKMPAIWVTKTATSNFEKDSIIDGIQRTTTLYGFVKDGFKLHKDIEPISIINDKGETVTYELAEKKYSQLPDTIQSLISDYSIDVVQMFNYTDEEIESQFFRLNNGVTFNRFQRIKVILGTSLAKKIQEIEKLPFWSRTAITKRQRKVNEVTGTIMQCLMLLTEYDYKSFSSRDIEAFAKYYAKNNSAQEVEYLKELIECLDSVLPTSRTNNKFLKKINIPALIMNLDKFKSIENYNFSTDDYTRFLTYFIAHQTETSGYMDYCGQSSTVRAKVEGRVATLDDLLDKSFNAKCGNKTM